MERVAVKLLCFVVYAAIYEIGYRFTVTGKWAETRQVSQICQKISNVP